ncbi:AbfB domain-containing protein [Streptomyces sp. NPDC101249]|uniref:AbfB domain-containing protein n=1 Tax=Streptomyces sp. NPDC101249 TaxID=3366140 RepID=UPI00382D669D
MPEQTPRPPQDHPWDTGWTPDTARTPGTRRLWLAGVLALATVAACATAISVTDRHRDRPERTAAAPAPSDQVTEPGLISFGSPSPSEAASPAGETDEKAADGERTPRTPDAPAHRSATPSAPAAPSAPRTSPTAAPKPSATWRSLRSVNQPDRFWHVTGGLVRLDPVGSARDRADATFKLVKGLADSSCYSFATAGGGYLRHRDFVLRAEHDDGSALFEKDATFCARPAEVSGAVVLESVNFPGRFLRHRDFLLRLDPFRYGPLYRADSAFRLVDGLGTRAP